MKYKALLLLALAPAALLLAGCGLFNSGIIQSSGLRALKKRYDVKFTYLAEDRKVGSGDVFGNHGGLLEFYAEAEDLPGKKIHVYSEDGRNFGSDYINKKYEDDTIDLIGQIAHAVYDDEDLRVVLSDYYVNDLDKDTTFEEYLESEYLNIVRIYTTDNDDPEGDFDKFVQLLIVNRINCEPTTYHFKENVYLDESVNVHALDIELKHGKMMTEGFEKTLEKGFKRKYVFRSYF